MHFPTVSGHNLLREKLVLPRDLPGALNVVLIPFQQWQQATVDSWLPFLQQLESDTVGLRYYELPTIRRMNRLYRRFINEGMRAGIPDPVARERTITLYLDKKDFRQALLIPHEEEIHLFLINSDGQVLWRTAGAFTPEKGMALATAVQQQLQKVMI